MIMGRRLYVGNLAFTVNSDQLRKLFSEQGEVVEANCITDRMTGRSKGFGFVEMATDEGATKAIEALNERNLDGRNMIVNEARERDAAPPRSGGGGFGGGGRGRGR
jgi:RNA recognition motif-containing protein